SSASGRVAHSASESVRPTSGSSPATARNRPGTSRAERTSSYQSAASAPAASPYTDTMSGSASVSIRSAARRLVTPLRSDATSSCAAAARAARSALNGSLGSTEHHQLSRLPRPTDRGQRCTAVQSATLRHCRLDLLRRQTEQLEPDRSLGQPRHGAQLLGAGISLSCLRQVYRAPPFRCDRPPRLWHLIEPVRDLQSANRRTTDRQGPIVGRALGLCDQILPRRHIGVG